MADLSVKVETLQGIGPRRAEALQKLGLSTLGELIAWFPRRYEDRRESRPIAVALKVRFRRPAALEEGEGSRWKSTQLKE